MKTAKGTHNTIDRERYKQLQEENRKLKEQQSDFMIKGQVLFVEINNEIDKLKQEKQELVDTLIQLRDDCSGYVLGIYFGKAEELIKKHSNEA